MCTKIKCNVNTAFPGLQKTSHHKSKTVFQGLPRIVVFNNTELLLQRSAVGHKNTPLRFVQAHYIDHDFSLQMFSYICLGRRI